ncbi:hypothetical protein CT19431_MP30118 [Cupriavidus taiwanensis]|nr:hypothetical protein CT19431_MP30118 [Cupriavidus taiwanensis]
MTFKLSSTLKCGLPAVRGNIETTECEPDKARIPGWLWKFVGVLVQALPQCISVEVTDESARQQPGGQR